MFWWCFIVKVATWVVFPGRFAGTLKDRRHLRHDSLLSKVIVHHVQHVNDYGHIWICLNMWTHEQCVGTIRHDAVHYESGSGAVGSCLKRALLIPVTCWISHSSLTWKYLKPELDVLIFSNEMRVNWDHCSSQNTQFLVALFFFWCRINWYANGWRPNVISLIQSLGDEEDLIADRDSFRGSSS